MQHLDSVFILIAVVYLIFSGERRVKIFLLSIVSSFCLLHLWLETERWQMVPAYIFLFFAWIGLVFTSVACLPRGRVFPFLLLFASLGLSFLLPIYTPPLPGGQYTVGITTRHLVDSSRAEFFTPNPNDSRELGVSIWYPAKPSLATGKTNYWVNDAERNRAMAAFLRLPESMGFIFSHIAKVKTNSFAGIPVADGKFPLLVFSHARNVGTREQNTVLMEHLASHGYIVVSITHPFWGLFYRYPDGRYARSDYVQEEYRRLFGRETTEELRRLPVYRQQSFDVLLRLLTRAAEIRKDSKSFTKFGIDILSGDQSFVLDQVELMNQDDDIFRGKIRLDQIGLMGMSDGGTTSLQTCTRDERCNAVVNIDGYASVSLDYPPMKVPMLLLSQSSVQFQTIMHGRAKSDSFLVKVSGTGHLNFSDFALFSPALTMTPILGSIDPVLGLEITNFYVKAFFDKALLGKTDHIETSELFSAVTVEVK